MEINTPLENVPSYLSIMLYAYCLAVQIQILCYGGTKPQVTILIR